MAFNLDDYEPVADRIERFWNDHAEGRILTELVHSDGKTFIVKALIYRGYKLNGEAVGPDATGYAEEVIGSTNVNRTSALENCETSAIGRALANLGYAVKNRASREEMAKAQPAPRPRSGPQRRTPTVDTAADAYVEATVQALQRPVEASKSHEDAPSAALADVVAGYARDQVARFSKWSEAERADSYKRHSKSLLDGKPISLEEVDKVVNAMIEEYQARFPGELPI